MRQIIIPVNVLLDIENYCYSKFKHLTDKEINKIIDATVNVFDILYSIKEKYGVDEYGYFEVDSRNKELQANRLMFEGEKMYYKSFIDILIDALIIMENPSWSTGTETTEPYCKSYMLNCEWGSLFEYKIHYVKYKSNIDNQREELIHENPEHEDLINTLHRVNIDIEGLVKNLKANLGKKLKPKAYRNIYGRTIIDRDRVIDEETIYRCIYNSLRINNRRIYYSVYDRVYSSFSNLSSLCHEYIMIDGIKMKEVDVVNCQPLLLCTLVNDDKLKRVCERGKFYEALMGATGIEDRDEIKIDCYRDLFFGRYKPNSILGKAFQELFPDAHRYLLNYQYDMDETLAKNLQIKEAEIFVNVAIETVKDFPVMTKHDALFVPYNSIREVKRKLTKKFQEYGINPRF